MAFSKGWPQGLSLIQAICSLLYLFLLLNRSHLSLPLESLLPKLLEDFLIDSQCWKVQWAGLGLARDPLTHPRLKNAPCKQSAIFFFNLLDLLSSAEIPGKPFPAPVS